MNFFSSVATSAITEKDLQSIANNPNIESVAALSVISGVPTIDKQEYSDGLVIATHGSLADIISQKVEFGNFSAAATATGKSP